MLKDGLYELSYRALSSPEGTFDSMLLVLRKGRLLGADAWGGCAWAIARSTHSGATTTSVYGCIFHPAACWWSTMHHAVKAIRS